MNRTRDYYRKQRKRIIHKKTYRYSLCCRWCIDVYPSGRLGKNKFHCRTIDKQTKTNPRACSFKYGDKKRNWKNSERKIVEGMDARLALYLQGEIEI